MHKTSVIRRETFNAAHRLYRKDWSDEKNHEIFGACSNPNWHGHNYTLEVKLSGYVDEQTGFVYDLKRLKELIQNEIVERFDHRNLNMDTAEFKNLNPTAENIARTIYDLLRSKISAEYDLHIKLFETPRNIVEYPAT